MRLGMPPGGWLDLVSHHRSRRARLGLAALAAVSAGVVAVTLAVRAGEQSNPPRPAAEAAAASCGYDQRVHGNPLLAGGHAPGGVVAVLPRGAIPAIDEPRFEASAAARAWLGPGAPVVVVRVGADVRAYPSAILLWHEVVNDVVGGRPLLVTFCPLCNTAVVYERRIDGVTHRFEVSGELALGAAVLYDRADGTRYAQPTGRPLGVASRPAGLPALAPSREVHAPARQPGPLRWYPSDLMTLDKAASANPGLVVLSRDTGYARDYGTSPYPRTGRLGTTPSLFDGYLDTRLDPKTHLVGAVVDGTPQAWRYDALREVTVRNDEVAGRPVVVIFRADTTSIGDSIDLAAAPAVGSAGVFDAVVGGRRLQFDAHSDGILTDRDTGSVWDLSGLAVRGPLAGARLAPLPHLDTYWYVWAARYPGTGVWPPLPAGPCSAGGRDG